MAEALYCLLGLVNSTVATLLCLIILQWNMLYLKFDILCTSYSITENVELGKWGICKCFAATTLFKD